MNCNKKKAKSLQINVDLDYGTNEYKPKNSNKKYKLSYDKNSGKNNGLIYFINTSKSLEKKMKLISEENKIIYERFNKKIKANKKLIEELNYQIKNLKNAVSEAEVFSLRTYSPGLKKSLTAIKEELNDKHPNQKRKLFSDVCSTSPKSTKLGSYNTKHLSQKNKNKTCINFFTKTSDNLHPLRSNTAHYYNRSLEDLKNNRNMASPIYKSKRNFNRNKVHKFSNNFRKESTNKNRVGNKSNYLKMAVNGNKKSKAKCKNNIQLIDDYIIKTSDRIISNKNKNLCLHMISYNNYKPLKVAYKSKNKGGKDLEDKRSFSYNKTSQNIYKEMKNIFNVKNYKNTKKIIGHNISDKSTNTSNTLKMTVDFMNLKKRMQNLCKGFLDVIKKQNTIINQFQK